MDEARVGSPHRWQTKATEVFERIPAETMTNSQHAPKHEKPL